MKKAAVHCASSTQRDNVKFPALRRLRQYVKVTIHKTKNVLKFVNSYHDMFDWCKGCTRVHCRFKEVVRQY